MTTIDRGVAVHIHNLEERFTRLDTDNQEFRERLTRIETDTSELKADMIIVKAALVRIEARQS